jgi:hypothetical protein
MTAAPTVFRICAVVTLDQTIAQTHSPAGVARNLGLMGDENDRVATLI